MCNQFPLALRLAKFVPYPDHFIYQVRKCSAFPSSVGDEYSSSNIDKRVLYTNNKETVERFTPEGASCEYQVRTTSLIGSKMLAGKKGDLECFPSNTDFEIK